MLVQTPPLGWNSWNTFGPDICEQTICETADAFITTGLKDAGYQYLVIDDCWSEKERDPVTHRLVPDAKKFPHGMKYVADYVHSKGLKFGIYSCAGVRTCANYPGSFDHEFLDAKTFAEWGIDFLKYDFCFTPSTASGQNLYRRMGHALRACGRDILFSACNWGVDASWAWMRSAGAHMYRSTGDIFDNFESFKNIFMSQVPHPEYLKLDNPNKEEFLKDIRAFGGCAAHAPNCFNDIDMLTVGMFGKGNVGTSGCNANEYRTQFIMWALFGSPLMLGADIRNLDPEILALVKNPGLLAINQDPECRPVYTALQMNTHNRGDYPVLARLLANGDIALAFFNFTENDHEQLFLFESMGIPFGSGVDLKFRDAMTGEDMGTYRENVALSVKGHGCVLVRATPVWR